MVVDLPIVIYAFPMHIITSLSVDEILLLRYANRSSNFRCFSSSVKIAPFLLKHMNFVLSEFMQRPMTCGDCSRLCSRDLAWAGALGRNARLST